MTMKEVAKSGWVVKSMDGKKFLDADGKWSAVPEEKAHFFEGDLDEVMDFLKENLVGECYMRQIFVFDRETYYGVKMLRTSEGKLVIEFKK